MCGAALFGRLGWQRSGVASEAGKVTHGHCETSKACVEKAWIARPAMEACPLVGGETAEDSSLVVVGWSLRRAGGRRQLRLSAYAQLTPIVRAPAAAHRPLVRRARVVAGVGLFGKATAARSVAGRREACQAATGRRGRSGILSPRVLQTLREPHPRRSARSPASGRCSSSVESDCGDR